MMDADLKAEWCAALRSGDFEQGGELMHANDGTYCCLGVLRETTGSGGDTSAFPTDAELEEWGLDRTDAWKLAWRNDGTWSHDDNPNGTKLTFKGIASYIENRKTL